MDKFLSLKNQFKYCTNAFSVDTYEGCNFGCKYCFSNNRNGAFSSKRKNEAIDSKYLNSFFYKAFESKKEYKDITIELLKNKVPLHLGGMADPFQPREFTEKMTYELLQLSNKYNYPIMISTKTAHLPSEYWSILNKDIHAFQISICGVNEDFIKKYEVNTPTAIERINFIKELHNRGFWVGLRLQPLIDINEALLLVNEVKDIVDYITVEHIKIATDNFNVRGLFKDMLNKYPFCKPKKSRNYELPTNIKLQNVRKIQAIAKCPIGYADNDLHKYNNTKSCCGIDTINENFNNYLKYNKSYFEWHEYNQVELNKENIWIPQNSCKKCMHGDYCVKDLFKINEYVDKYLSETIGMPYKIHEDKLLKEIGMFYGDYFEENNKYIIDNGLQRFEYDNIKDGLKDWVDTLKEDYDTDWTNEIEFIENLK